MSKTYPLIRKIKSAKDKGAFKNVTFNHSPFKKVNVIFGENYSGKTSLSRAFHELDDPQLSSLSPDCKFIIGGCPNDKKCNACHCNDFEKCTNAYTISNTLTYEQNPIEVSSIVYNEDYKNRNLKFLITPDNEDKIKPIETLIIGEDAVTAQNNIEKYEKEKKEKSAEIESLKNNKTPFFTQKKNIESNIREAFRNDIKGDKLYIDSQGKQNVTKSTVVRIINNFYGKYSKDLSSYNPLSDEQKKTYQDTLRENLDANYTPPNLLNMEYDLNNLIKKTNELLIKKVAKSSKLEELISNNTLEGWVKEGLNLHTEPEKKCKFCQNDISNQRWQQIIQHFSKEYDELMTNIELLSNDIENKIAVINTTENEILKQKTNFLERFQEKRDRVFNKFSSTKKEHLEILQSLKERIKNKKSDIYNAHEVFVLPNNLLVELLLEYNALCSTNQEAYNKISDAKKTAREKLQDNFLFSALSQEYTIKDKQYNYKTITQEEHNFTQEILEVDKGIEILNQKITQQIEKTKTIKQAMTEINDYLAKSDINHFCIKEYLINDSIQYQVYYIDEQKEARHLSTGEKSFLAFCYFLVDARNKIQKAKEGKIPMIIYVDDPISSLDSPHIIEVYGLLRDMIDENEKNDNIQFFISTHNKEFLENLTYLPSRNDYYLNKFSTPKEFKDLPPTFKKAALQIHELFKEVYEIAHERDPNTDNISVGELRRFLEAYCQQILGISELEDGITKIIPDKGYQQAILSRGANSLAHYSASIDPNIIKNTAKAILIAIKKDNNSPYQHLLNVYEKNNEQMTK